MDGRDVGCGDWVFRVECAGGCLVASGPAPPRATTRVRPYERAARFAKETVVGRLARGFDVGFAFGFNYRF